MNGLPILEVAKNDAKEVSLETAQEISNEWAESDNSILTDYTYDPTYTPTITTTQKPQYSDEINSLEEKLENDFKDQHKAYIKYEKKKEDEYGQSSLEDFNADNDPSKTEYVALRKLITQKIKDHNKVPLFPKVRTYLMSEKILEGYGVKRP